MKHGFLREVRLERERVPSFEKYPFSIPAVRHLDRLILDSPVTFLVGENGTGKSTLIEAIAILVGFNAEGGTRNFGFSTRPSESDLSRYLQPVRSARRPKAGFFLRAESLFNVATEAENRSLEAYGWASLHEMSHGESFLWLLREKFTGNGLYVLDEPEAALSPIRQLAALKRMDELVRSGAQFVIATHSPILMAYPGARIYELSSSAVRSVRFEDTEHYLVTRDFLNNPALFLARLRDDDASQ